MKKTTLIFAVFTLLTAKPFFAQHTDSLTLEHRIETLENNAKRQQRLRITGYIQAQYQYAEREADNVNFRFAPQNSFEKSDDSDGFHRFGIRRGHIKLDHQGDFAETVVQLDITENGVNPRDIFINVKDSWLRSQSAFRAGLFHHPFGFEAPLSSRLRESPERSRVVQSLFPNSGRDVGFKFILRSSETSPWSFLSLDVGLFSGNGIRRQMDSHMDFVGRLSANKKFKTVSLSGGTSLYWGGVRAMSSEIYTMKNNRFVLKSDKPENIGKVHKRQYVGFDAQLGLKTTLGQTKLMTEYIVGEHPGNSVAAYSFQLTALPTDPVFRRKINGGYAMLVQDLGKLPLATVLKYDWYNPNTQVSGNDIGIPGSLTGVGDIAIQTFGFGMLWNVNNAFRITAYYDIVRNEKSSIKTLEDEIVFYGFENIRPANVFTLRLQYSF
jgi:hypothetical protein